MGNKGCYVMKHYLFTVGSYEAISIAHEGDKPSGLLIAISNSQRGLLNNKLNERKNQSFRF